MEEITLKDLSHRVRNQLQEHLWTPGGIAKVVSEYQDCVYIKSRDGTIVFSNLEYEKRFAGGFGTPGHVGTSFLSKVVAEVSHHSDSLITGECEYVEFVYLGTVWATSRARRVLARLHTVKLSISEFGDSAFAILGITRVLRELSTGVEQRLRTLQDSKARIDEMSAQMRHCIQLLAQGESASSIAESTGLSRRTVEKHKHDSLGMLGLRNACELAQLLCRLQDAGMGDYGVFQMDHL